MSKPSISVLIDTYNHERFIDQAITSVLEQDMPMADVEIIVVDDGSTDRTPEIIRAFEPRVRVLRKSNGGQASAFNAGIPECQGEIIAFLDGDDWWAPEKLRRVVGAMERDPEVGIVGHGVTESFPDGRQQSESLREISRFRLDSMNGARTFRARKNFFGTSRMTIRSRLIPLLLPVPECLWFEADEYLFTLAAGASTALVLPEALTFYRIHNGNLFQVFSFNENSIRRKQTVLACLARELTRRLDELGVAAATAKIITEVIIAEADQLRLMIDGGYPWETVRTEFAMYGILHGTASPSQWMFKCASLLPGLVLPPRLFYRARRWVATNKLYLRARKSLLPVPQPEHTVRLWKTGL
jgi:glycosyltransferase involved in cell wall biosynthesis